MRGIEYRFRYLRSLMTRRLMSGIWGVIGRVFLWLAAVAHPAGVAAVANPADMVFVVPDTSFSRIEDQVEISNMPLPYNQFGLGMCSAAVAATLLHFEWCRAEHSDCTVNNSRRRISVLDLSRYRWPEGQARVDSNKMNRSAFRGFSPDGGQVIDTMVLAMYIGRRVAHEECFSLSSIFKIDEESGDFDSSAALFGEKWKKLRMIYDGYKSFEGRCDACQSLKMEELGKFVRNEMNIGSKLNIDALKNKENSNFGIFLDELFGGLRRCLRPTETVWLVSDGVIESGFPENVAGVNVRDIKRVIISTLSEGKPISLSALCVAGTKDPSKCPKEYFHAIVIAGYRKQCNNASLCVDVFKAVNSWGAQWQKNKNDGWILADKLLEHVYIQPNLLFWLADK